MENEFLPMCQVRHSTTIYYDYYTGHRVRNATSFNPYHTPNTYKGNVSASSEKRIRRAIDLLLQLSPERIIYNPVIDASHPFTINFITLTVSDSTIRHHKEVYQKCLRSYLKWQIRKGAKHYIWKAELQQRGQIHYHITTNCFIHYMDIQKKWNSLQKKAGYLSSFAQQHHHYSPNSTDVHSVRNVKNIEAYLIKYICKGIGSGVIKGKIWDCSDSLKKPYFSSVLESQNLPVVRDTRYIVKERFALWKGKADLTQQQQKDYNHYINSL